MPGVTFNFMMGFKTIIFFILTSARCLGQKTQTTLLWTGIPPLSIFFCKNKLLKKTKRILLLQYSYDIFCFAAMLALCTASGLKDGITTLISLFILLFIIPFFPSVEKTNQIAFTIIHACIAWLGWTALITFHLTEYLYSNFIKDEHSIWDLFAFLLPVLFMLLTIWWDLQFRIFRKWYEPAYLTSLAMAIFIATNYCWQYICRGRQDDSSSTFSY